VRIHPSDFLLRDAFGRRDVPGDRRRALLNHLGRCARCRERLRELMHPMTGPSAQKLSTKRSQTVRAADYQAVLERSFQTFEVRQAALARERADAPTLLLRLLDQPPERRELLVRNSRRYQTWALAELLLARSLEKAFETSRGSEELARLGLLLVGQLDGIYYGDERINDLNARAWAHIANAHRIRSESHLAESAFNTAADYLHSGSGDPLEKASFLDLRASLLRAQRRVLEAEGLFERAAAIRLEAEEWHLAGRALLGLSFALSVAARHLESIRSVLQASNFIDSDCEPHLMLCVSHNLVCELTNAGQPKAAETLWRMTQPLYEKSVSRPLEARRCWIAGRLAFGLGRLEEGSGFLVRARECFLAEGLRREADFVGGDLAQAPS
jgi:tetratricopeptide (TPR) repeat protein